MKLNFDKKPKNAKDAAKQAQKKIDDYRAVAGSADYQAKQEQIQTPFGQAFKTGAVIDKKKELNKGAVKHKGKGWE